MTGAEEVVKVLRPDIFRARFIKSFSKRKAGRVDENCRTWKTAEPAAAAATTVIELVRGIYDETIF